MDSITLSLFAKRLEIMCDNDYKTKGYEMKKFEIYLGLNDKTTKRQEINTLDAYKLCVNVCKDCSIQELTGFYTHKDGITTTEKTFKIELFDKTKTEVEAISNQLKVIFNQEKVIINEITCSSKFI